MLTNTSAQPIETINVHPNHAKMENNNRHIKMRDQIITIEINNQRYSIVHKKKKQSNPIVKP